MADALIAADAAGQVVAFNPAAEQLTGRRRQDAIGRHLCDVLGCKGDPECADEAPPCAEGCPVLDALHTGGVLREEQRTIRTCDGMRRVISLSAAYRCTGTLAAAAAAAARSGRPARRRSPPGAGGGGA